MKREVIQTEDGSTTIRIANWEECYHSKHGAIQESYHVFIKNGLSKFKGKSVSILEIGFGTGLNAFITLLEAKKIGQEIDYTGVEAFPISVEEIGQMNYGDELEAGAEKHTFRMMHDCSWEIPISISSDFKLTKQKKLFQEIEAVGEFDLIYFDAFGFRVQPELWSEEIFKIMFTALKEKGVLVTYAARGIIKRNMAAVGFVVKKTAGPPGKREMMIGFKNFFKDGEVN